MSEVRAEHTYVYVIAHIRRNKPIAPVKVGISASPEKRLHSFRTANAFDLVLLCTFYCPDRAFAREMEAIFHECESDSRMSGEWFNIHPRDAAARMCEYFRAVFEWSGLSDDETDLALKNSGVSNIEQKLEQWTEHLQRKNNDNHIPEAS